MQKDSKRFDPDSRKRFYRLAAGLEEDAPADSMFRTVGEHAPGEISRRRFLSLLSASAALALGASGCSTIDRGSIVPYTKRPGEIIPGKAAFYASTFQEGLLTQGVLVKTREGRPIHLEGNPDHIVSRGKTDLRAMADLLGLYDPDRLRSPVRDGVPSSWEEADREIARILSSARTAGKPVLLLTEAILSPTRRAVIRELRRALPTLYHAAWEPAACGPELSAARALYGKPLLPHPRFDRAEVILAFQSDFLGADGNAAVRAGDFAARRRIFSPEEPMNRLWVAEGPMTLTGANADQRLEIRPSQAAPLIFSLLRRWNRSRGMAPPPGLDPESLAPFELHSVAGRLGIEASALEALAEDLRRGGSSALIVAGSALPMEAHVACALANAMLGADSHTVEWTSVPAAADLLTHSELRKLFGEAASGAFAAAVFWGANPAYAFPDAGAWKRASAGVPEKIRIGLYEDETALDCRWRLPEHHWLESWGDFEPAAGLLSLRQPGIGPLYDTRQGEDILLGWLSALGAGTPPGRHEYMKARWKKEVYPAGSPVAFEDFWNAALQDGILAHPSREENSEPFVPTAKPDAIEAAVRAAGRSTGTEEMELVLAPGAAVYDGRYANNGWLEELPDPVTKATWGNPVLLSIPDAERLGVSDEDLVRITAGAASVEAPVIVQPGQCPGVASLALGYGRRTGNVAAGIGVNAWPLLDAGADSPFLRTGVEIARVEGKRPVPRTQLHFLMEGRDTARSWTRAEYSRHLEETSAESGHQEHASLIPAPEFPGHKWSMAIDLAACTGCSACIIACQSENNVPVVGPEQVLVNRQMHWIRIDRYYEGDLRHPSVRHQPVPCQHCDDAPCEIVCPVNATTHSPDGLNQMAYNRCVGTRYCSNNCPFKVRRFNFLDYTSMKRPPEDLVYNPEVTVRPRGVMEKCSFCIQRIENARQQAKIEGRPVADGEITPACAAACPTGAIVFGDVNDPKSRVSLLAASNRGYRMLEELGIRPSITYLADISNPAIERGNG